MAKQSPELTGNLPVGNTITVMHTYTAHATVDLSRNVGPEKSPLTAHSRGRGKWDCIRQMQLYRTRPDVLAAALRDMGFNESGDEVTDDQYSDN
jgi:hypothetical protein